jgi:hypothetical protein
MVIALFASRSITSPPTPQREVRFQSGIACRCPQREQSGDR